VSSDDAENAEDLERFILMRAKDTFDGQERMF
jgi:hypothetical protein